MSAILDEIQKFLVLPIDFPSQKRTFELQQNILLIGAIAASIYGFLTQSLYNTLICYGVTFVVTLLLVVPPYPFYNKQKLQWVQPKLATNL
ncbi:hypothetical protein NCAS_0D01820 [Naumovozyma castellii]|uniref:Signal peptidase complex subunit 1 n=1 Tax=Naumovozyma castellii TaxID=27288 RepID=G0VDX3_NAUCA|nr:hypothetical protein NCAS_0D01820 [Naumovozyma castellii CBS 4309]CCC69763.1 hypothetical protein NCAS_0D01820 [Naumovozyma castellii CBS 4309]